MSTTVVLTLEHLECANCSMVFGITPRFMQDRRNDRQTFYCPQGHSNYYPGKSPEQKLREAKAALEAEQRRVRATRDLLAAEERSHAATRGHVTRKKRELSRVKAGVCPVEGCRRHFVNLDRHMTTKHPEFHP